MLLRNDARRTRDDFLDIALSLPFQTDTNTGFGILAKVYLDATITIYGDTVKEGEESSEEAKEAKEQALELCEQTFVGIKNPRAEVERGFRFWDAVSFDWHCISHDLIHVMDLPPGAIELTVFVIPLCLPQLLVSIRSLAVSQANRPPNLADCQQRVLDQFEAADKWLRPLR